jgi:hypothetical protein
VWWEARPKYNVVDPDWELFGQVKIRIKDQLFDMKLRKVYAILTLKIFPLKKL